MSDRLPIGKSGLGTLSVMGRRRSPRPAARTKPFTACDRSTEPSGGQRARATPGPHGTQRLLGARSTTIGSRSHGARGLAVAGGDDPAVRSLALVREPAPATCRRRPTPLAAHRRAARSGAPEPWQAGAVHLT